MKEFFVYNPEDFDISWNRVWTYSDFLDRKATSFGEILNQLRTLGISGSLANDRVDELAAELLLFRVGLAELSLHLNSMKEKCSIMEEVSGSFTFPEDYIEE